MPTTSHPLRRFRLLLAAAGLLLTVLGGVALRTHRAAAVVVHGAGFSATVLGWTSWYGAYELPSLGTTWCIDHGRHAPDTTYPYRHTAVRRPADTLAAMAWLVDAHGDTHDPVGAASLMLVLHDLMGAHYPYGVLDVDTLQLANLGGFSGHRADVVATARAWKADALAHRQLRGPLTLALHGDRTGGHAPRTVVASVADTLGHPVAGIAVTFHGDGVATHRLVTDPSGRAQLKLTSPPDTGEVTADAVVPGLQLDAYTAGTAAQRVVRAAHRHLSATLAWSPPPPGTLRLVKIDRRTHVPLAGAVFRVAADTDGDGTGDRWARTITSATSPVSVDGLAPGTWVVTETSAPPGYAADPNAHTVEVRSGQTVTITVADAALPATVSATKHDGVTGRALPGAVYDLYRQLPVGDDPTDAGEGAHVGEASPAPAATPSPPADAAQLDGYRWVGRATSDDAGHLSWPPQPPGYVYCAREVAAPVGYRRDPRLTCTTRRLAPAAHGSLTLTDHPTTTTSTTAPTTTTVATSTPPTAPRATPPTTPSTAPPTTRPGTAATPPPTGPPTTSAGSPPLAFTGGHSVQWASIGLGLLLLGVAAFASTRWPRPPG